MSSMEKIVASAPKLIPVAAPVVKSAAAAALPTAVAIATNPVVLTGASIYLGYKLIKKLF